mmetsp:Transcript_41787/g.50097  ORF Transcript_41787/g.50097 Transcript_41787/m.50097 type:complete len:123 (-) Transcript_41787:283-651(-)
MLPTALFFETYNTPIDSCQKIYIDTPPQLCMYRFTSDSYCGDDINCSNIDEISFENLNKSTPLIPVLKHKSAILNKSIGNDLSGHRGCEQSQESGWRLTPQIRPFRNKSNEINIAILKNIEG